MNSQGELHTQGALSDYFRVEGHLLSTRTADAYKAVDKSRNQPVTLWMMKHQFTLNSDTVRAYLARMQKIQAALADAGSSFSYGVDSEGVAFCVLDLLQGQPLNKGNAEVSELERRFMACLHLVSQLHEGGIVCGDLCGSSFWLGSDGRISLAGIMGAFEASSTATSMMPPVETMPFMSPEQRSNAAASPSSDVFSLGVLAYSLFTGGLPYGQGNALVATQFNPDMIQPLSVFMDIPPVWGDEVIRKCLAPNPADRFQSATEILTAVSGVKERIVAAEKAPVLANSDRSVVKPDGTKGDHAPALTRVGLAVNFLLSRTGRVMLLALLIVLFLLVYVADKVLNAPGSEGSQVVVTEDPGFAGDLPEFPSEVAGVSNKGHKGTARIEALGQSEDPLAHHRLVLMSVDAKDVETRRLIEKTLLDRASRRGLRRSVAQVRQWLRTIRETKLPPAYQSVLSLLDTSLPVKDAERYIRRAYTTDADFVMRLTTALIFDMNKLKEFQPVMAQLAGDALELEDADKYSTLALIIAQDSLSQVFSDDINKNRKYLTDDDILWVLKILATRNDINTRSIANLAVKRGILSPQKQIFLKTVRDRGDLPHEVVTTLIKAAGGALTPADMQSLGKWYDRESEKLLLAIMADVKDDKAILKEAFSLVAAKNPTIEPSASLIKWVRTNYLKRSAEFAHAIGVMAFLDEVPQEEIESCFESLQEFLKGSSLVNELVKTDNPVVMKVLIEKYSHMLPVAVRLRMLSNPDKQIRIAAIKSLKHERDLGALKVIVDAYDRERDDDMRVLYRKTFWHLRSRK